MDVYRDQIEKIDLEILKLLEERLFIVSKIGEIKKTNNIPIYNKEREDEVVTKLKSYNLINSDYIDLIWSNIMIVSRDVQNLINIKF
jgi:chorismate mutase/prephenate dehydratase